jgi:PAS domain S-box-containing protein
MLSFFQGLSRAKLLFVAAMMILIVALIDWRVERNASFGFLYLFPMLIVGSCLPRWQLAMLGGLCTFLAELFSPFWNTWDPAAGVPRDIFMFAAYFGTALFAHESAKNRRLTAQHVQEVEQEALLRREAEQQLKILIESSPAAIVTLDSAGQILMANSAAHRLLGFEPETLIGGSINSFLPSLARVPPADESTPSFRTAMQCRGRRQDGEVFLAEIWFSTYKTKSGARLAAMIIDTSEDLRDREEFSLLQLLAGSRLAVGAVSHEIRNVCGAICVVYTNLSRNAVLAQNEDFRALGTLVEGLGRIATLELRQSTGSQELTGVDLYQLVEELRIVTEPGLQESGVSVHWDLPENLPRVWADRHRLLQVLLNLVKNSQRALQAQELRELTISALIEGERVVLRVRDSGSGVANPERLFQPFQPGAEATGLGLYLSRAFVRAFKGDLRYEPQPACCCFALDLTPFAEEDSDALIRQTNDQDQDSPA